MLCLTFRNDIFKINKPANTSYKQKRYRFINKKYRKYRNNWKNIDNFLKTI